MSFSKDLLKWYDKHHRRLPWRETKNPYLIWLSEIILQQTRVAQGMPYYYKFIDAFPDVFSLANATEDKVLKLWQGLGYYSRGRNLHAAAKVIVSNYAGVFPSTFLEIKKLKGIGDYTAAAIASFAYNLPHAVVDGNVYRVLSRLFFIKIPVNSIEGKKIFSQMAHEILDKRNAGKFNSAMMELGALVCKPQNPLCNICPVNIHCIAFKKNKQHEVPVKIKKLTVRSRYLNYFVIKNGNYIYIKQRKEKDIWQGLHDFPLTEAAHLFETPAEQKQAAIKITGEKNFKIENVSAVIKHQLTHQTLYAVFITVHCKLPLSVVRKNNWIKIKADEIHDYALPRLMERFVKGMESG